MTLPGLRRSSSVLSYLAQGGYALLVIVIVGLMVVGMPAFVADQDRGYINLNFDQNAQGELVLTPVAGYESDRAGIKTGDVLLGINGTPVPAGSSVAQASELARGNVGEAITLTVRSVDGSERTVTIIRSEQYLQALASVGMNNTTVTVLFAAIEILLTVAVVAISVWIFLKRRGDWLALLAAGILVILPAGLGVVNLPLAGAQQHGLYSLYEFIRSLALGLGVLLLFVFPTGKFFPRWTMVVAIVAGVYAVFFWTIFVGFNNLFYVWLWLAFFLVGVYAQVRRYVRASSPVEKKQTYWLLWGTIPVILVYFLMLVYEWLPASLLSWGHWIVISLVRNAVMTLALIFFAFSLRRALRKAE